MVHIFLYTLLHIFYTTSEDSNLLARHVHSCFAIPLKIKPSTESQYCCGLFHCYTQPGKLIVSLRSLYLNTGQKIFYKSIYLFDLRILFIAFVCLFFCSHHLLPDTVLFSCPLPTCLDGRLHAIHYQAACLPNYWDMDRGDECTQHRSLQVQKERTVM